MFILAGKIPGLRPPVFNDSPEKRDKQEMFSLATQRVQPDLTGQRCRKNSPETLSLLISHVVNQAGDEVDAMFRSVMTVKFIIGLPVAKPNQNISRVYVENRQTGGQ